MRIDRFAEIIKTASLKEQRHVTISLFIFVFSLLSLLLTPLWAQSNLSYELKVGTTGEVAVLADFPDSYAGEKINVKLRVENASPCLSMAFCRNRR